MKSPIFKLSVLIFSLLLASHFLLAQDAYHQNLQAKLAEDFNLPNGEFVLFDNEINLLNAAFNYGSTKQILDSEDTEFSKKVKLTISNQGTNPWDAGWGIGNQKRIEAGDKVLLVYHIRAIERQGRVNSYVERTSNFDKEAFYDMPIPLDWTTIYIPFEAKINYASGDLNFGFHLAHQAQILELGGFTAINYKKNVSLNDLPQSVNNEEYGGFEEDAPWRASAAERIDQLRKADLNITVKTTDGMPVKDAAIKVEMQEHEFGFGSAITAVRLAGNSGQNNIYQGRILDLDGKGHGFNWAVFENDLKWPAWEDNWFVNNNDAAKAVQWVADQGIKLRGHTLVWPGLQNLPNDIGQNANNPEYIKNRINGHLEDILTYPGVQGNVAEWDVLNEIVSNRSLQNIFAREEEYETGRELYVEIFNKVKEIDPNTGLWLNDFATITLNNTGGGGYDSLKLYISELLEAGVPLDGIGFQGHIGGFPNSIYDVLGTLDDFYDSFGLPAKITEFDMPVEMSEELAANYLRDFLTATFSHPSMDGFLFWSFWDGAAWRDGRNLFDLNWNRTKVGDTFVDLLFNEWWTDDIFASNENGEILARVFKGQYEVSYTCNGERVTETMSISEAMNLEVVCDNVMTNTTAVIDNPLEIYPNPASGQLFIELPSAPNENTRLRLLDLYGRTLLEKTLNTNQEYLDVKDLKGNYILEVLDGEQLQRKKVILY